MKKPIFTTMKSDPSAPIETVLDELFHVLRANKCVMKIGRDNTIIIGRIIEDPAAGAVGRCIAEAEIKQIDPNGIDWRKVEWEVKGPTQ